MTRLPATRWEKREAGIRERSEELTSRTGSNDPTSILMHDVKQLRAELLETQAELEVALASEREARNSVDFLAALWRLHARPQHFQEGEARAIIRESNDKIIRWFWNFILNPDRHFPQMDDNVENAIIEYVMGFTHADWHQFVREVSDL